MNPNPVILIEKTGKIFIPVNTVRTLFLEPDSAAAIRLTHKLEKTIILCDIITSTENKSFSDSISYSTTCPKSGNFDIGEISGEPKNYGPIKVIRNNKKHHGIIKPVVIAKSLISAGNI